MNNTEREIQEFWNRVASDWDIQVGENGDSNRILNSDPILWKLVGDVENLRILDAGCGTGYLKKCIEPPWKHFTSEFIWFHRPLSDYWKAFKASGFEIVEFDEPRLTAERFHLAESEKQIQNGTTRPYSVAFKLQKVKNIPDMVQK